MLQNPDGLHYMTARVQGDNVKLKMVVDCDRLVFGLGGDAEKGSFLCA